MIRARNAQGDINGSFLHLITRFTVALSPLHPLEGVASQIAGTIIVGVGFLANA